MKLPFSWTWLLLKGVGMNLWNELLNVTRKPDWLKLLNLFYIEIEQIKGHLLHFIIIQSRSLKDFFGTHQHSLCACWR